MKKRSRRMRPPSPAGETGGGSGGGPSVPRDWTELVDCPLKSMGVHDAPPAIGATRRFSYGTSWPTVKIDPVPLPRNEAYYFEYPIPGGSFVTVTLVVAATEAGLPKAIVCPVKGKVILSCIHCGVDR